MLGAIAFLLVFVVGMLLLSARGRRARLENLRPIPGYVAARQAVARSAERGQPIHLSTGPGGIGDNSTTSAETLAGLELTTAMAQHCAASGAPVLATTGDGLTFTLAENAVRTGYANVGRSIDAPVGPGSTLAEQPDEARQRGVRMLAHRDPLAYSAAATDLSDSEQVLSAATVGGWGPEYLLLATSQRRRGVESVAGATSPEALAVMSLSADHTLIGEEIYAAGAYLQQRPLHIASLLTQDAVRWIIIALIIVGALLTTIGLPIGSLLRLGE